MKRFIAVSAILLFASAVQADDDYFGMFPGPSFFKKHFSNQPTGRVELRPPVRLEDFVVDGTLELSLRSYLELVMANNTDIEIQRVSLELSRNAILRSYQRFDPVLTGSFTNQRTKQPSTSALEGAAVSNQLSQPVRFNYVQTLSNGTQYNVGFFGQKISSNSSFTTFNPALTANLSVGFTQPLLRDRGGSTWKLPIMIAKSQYKANDYSMQDQIMQRLVTAENAYWQVVQERENLKVQEEALKLADATLKRNQRELELGALSPLEIYRPQADYALAEIQVSQARYRLVQAEDGLRRQVGADLDPAIRTLPIRLTEQAEPPLDEGEIDREAAVERGLQSRPDLKAQLQQLDVGDLNIRDATNRLRPQLDLTGNYTSTGRGGTFYQRSNVFGSDGSRNSLVSVIPGGFGDALDQLFAFNYPIYSFGLTLRLPIRDRAASAQMADAVVNKRLAALRARNLEQQIRQDILNAVSQVESSKAAVKLAVVQRDLQKQSLDAEQKKYELGVNTIFFVLDAQQRLTQAESQLVTQLTNYRRNTVTLLRVTGELLESRGIVVQ